MPTPIQTDSYTLLTGHVIEQLRTLPAGSVQCVLTSPPYLWLRSYGTEGAVWGGNEAHEHVFDRHNDTECECGAWKGELGQERSLESYVAHLVQVFREVRRVLRDDGVCWLNIGDTFNSDSRTKLVHTKSAGPASVPDRHNVDRWKFKRKDMIGVPWALGVALREDGWYLRQEVIWSKAGGNCPRCHYRIEKGSSLPEPVFDRFARAHETVLLLSKKSSYFFDLEGARDPQSNSNRRDVVHVSATKFRGAHFASMPPALARILVRAGASSHGACAKCGAPWERIVERGAALDRLKQACGADAEGNYTGEAVKDYESAEVQNASDVKRRILNSMRERITAGWKAACECNADVVACKVLDPFSGAGTTGVAAVEMGMHYVGIEIDEKCNQEIAAPRLQEVKREKTPVIDLPAGSGVYHGPSEEILQRLPSAIARMILTDPPYNVSRENNFHTMGRTGISFDWDGDFDQEAWLRHADRVLMPGGSLVIWNDWKVLGLIAHTLMDMGYDVKRPLTWVKSNPMPRNTDRTPVQAVEMGLWAVKPGAKWVFNKRGASYEDFVFRYPIPRGKKDRPRHETKKPDDLFGEIIEILSNPGELIVDPFCGGGTLAYAAESRGRAHISIDMNETWVKETQARWKEAVDDRATVPPTRSAADAD